MHILNLWVNTLKIFESLILPEIKNAVFHDVRHGIFSELCPHID